MTPSKPGHSAPRRADAPKRRRLPVLLRRAWFGLNQAFRRRIAHLEVTPDQFTVMRSLVEHPGATQSQLTAIMSSDPNTIAALLDRMEKNKLILRKRHESDRRAFRAFLTAEGNQKFDAAREIALSLQTEVLLGLKPSSRATFLRHLEAVAEACNKLAERS